MKIKEGFILRKIADADIVVPIGNNIADFNGIITLNETAVFLWKLLKDGAEQPDMVEALMKEYEISRELAQTDIDNFVERLNQSDLLMEN